MRILCQRHNSQSSRGVWSDIRHYIGRLGSWTKATQILILGAQIFPRRIENARVDVVGPEGPADLPNITHLTDLRGLVQRMLPADQAALVEDLSQALIETDMVAQIDRRFREDYANIEPRPHAELLVLEHFYRNSFSFVDGDKYIGCSKPSCYCCHAYIQCHPGGFAPRPCHGNLWINWAPPIPLLTVGPTSGRKRPRTRLQQQHTFQMLQKILVSIRQDLQDQILSRRPKRNRLPDSTTGMSSVIYEIHAPRITLEHSAEELSTTSGDRSDRRFAPFENVEGTDIQFEITEDAPSGSYSDDVDREVFGHLFSERPTTDTLEGGEENDDGDDESDGGVLLFRGRRVVPSRSWKSV